MGRIKGIPIILINKVDSGEKNELGEVIFNITEKTINNVLVAPTNSDDIPQNLDLDLKRTLYTLAIPKNDNNLWSNAEVRFFNQTFKVISEPIQGIDDLIPLSWNKKIIVERLTR